MKKLYLAVLSIVLFFVIGVFSLNAQDLIILRNGDVIEAKVTEISPTEIRYKRFNHLDGPTIVIPTNSVLSIRYENGTLEVINQTATGGAVGGASDVAFGSTPTPQQTGLTSPLQMILNALPAIPIAGNNLKFEFSGDTWTARVNGENFSAGTIEFEITGDGGILRLRQTHIWPGAVGRTAGRIANLIPGGGAVAGVLDTAGSVAGALVGAVETSGTEIILQYSAGPPASLRLLSFTDTENKTAAQSTREPSPSDDDWKNKWFYLGDTLGFFGIVSSNYYYFENHNLPAFGLTTELALLPFFSIELDLALGLRGFPYFVMPILAKLGGRIAKVELSFDIGYIIDAMSAGG